MIVAGVIALLCTLLLTTWRDNVETKEIQTLLSEVVSNDRATEVSAMARCTVQSTPSRDVDLCDYKVTNLTIWISLNSSSGSRALWQKSYQNSWEGSYRSSTPPLWSGRVVYAPDTDGVMKISIPGRTGTPQLLPTMKLRWSSDRDILGVLAEGDTLTTFLIDITDATLKEVSPIDAATRSKLAKWYPQAFDVNDVYWSRSIVAHATYFDPSMSDATPDGTIERIFEKWRENCQKSSTRSK